MQDDSVRWWISGSLSFFLKTEIMKDVRHKEQNVNSSEASWPLMSDTGLARLPTLRDILVQNWEQQMIKHDCAARQAGEMGKQE